MVPFWYAEQYPEVAAVVLYNKVRFNMILVSHHTGVLCALFLIPLRFSHRDDDEVGHGLNVHLITRWF